MSDITVYFHMSPETPCPEIIAMPSRFIVVIEADVSRAWRKLVSDWIVASGCLYMMAWGRDCSSWDDSVDWSNIDRFDEKPIPNDEFVITTWHERETLAEVFCFAKTMAAHRFVELDRTVILDISVTRRKDKLLGIYNAA